LKSPDLILSCRSSAAWMMPYNRFKVLPLFCYHHAA
jgi:hypothetical protein